MNQEKDYSPVSGYVMLLVVLVLLGISIFGLAAFKQPLFVVLLLFSIILLPGFFIVNPNGSKVLVLFGDYRGTVKKNGFFFGKPILFEKAHFTTRP